jgi:hypothetical protein
MESVTGSEYIHIKIKFLLLKLERIKVFIIQVELLNKQKLLDISPIGVFLNRQDVSYSWDLMLGFVSHEVSNSIHY